MKRLLTIAVVAAGCGGDLDEAWQLDHDRIVAVRATPPAIMAGERAILDALIAVAGGPTVERPPDIVTVIGPQSLASALSLEAGGWTVTGPNEAALAAARTELNLPPGTPVPLQLGFSFGQLLAVKSIDLGAVATNPMMPSITIDGAAPPTTGDELVIGSAVDVPLTIAAGPTDKVNWLTSCGTMHDFDLPNAYLRVEPADPTAGELAVVLRDERGGVVWRVWRVRAD